MKLVRHRRKTYLGHDHILAFLHVFAVCFHDGLQEPQVFHMAAMRLDAVHEVLDDPLADLVAQMVIVHEDVPHSFRLEELSKEGILTTVMRSPFYPAEFRFPDCHGPLDLCEATMDYQALFHH